MRTIKTCFSTLAVLFFALLIGCGNQGGGTTTSGKEFAETAVTNWEGVDFSYNNPDGYTDSDFDGAVDANDAVIFVETFRALGFAIPATTMNGLYGNYFTSQGYDEGTNPDPGDRTSFSYTVSNSTTQADLQAGDFSKLAVGDLIFVDHDEDLNWDNAAVYLGASGGFANAVLVASDYYDKVVIENLDDPTAIITQDIAYGYSDSRTPDYDTIEGY
jgi:hypothetical protein